MQYRIRCTLSGLYWRGNYCNEPDPARAEIFPNKKTALQRIRAGTHFSRNFETVPTTPTETPTMRPALSSELTAILRDMIGHAESALSKKTLDAAAQHNIERAAELASQAVQLAHAHIEEAAGIEPA